MSGPADEDEDEDEDEETEVVLKSVALTTKQCKSPYVVIFTLAFSQN